VYRWKYVKPGEQLGTSFDGLIYVNSHWAWFPKPWRVLDSGHGGDESGTGGGGGGGTGGGGGSDSAAGSAAGSAAPAGGW